MVICSLLFSYIWAIDHHSIYKVMNRFFALFVIAIFLSVNSAQSQDTTMQVTPYASIESYPEVFTAATMVARTIDGLGYRYYWATEGLTDEDLIFRPSEDASNVIETLEHLLGLTEGVLNCISGKPNIRPQAERNLSYQEMRHESLINLKKASDLLIASPDMDMSTRNVIFKRGDNESVFEFWHLLNGHLSDAIYHTGQIVSFRRTNENPVNPKMNVFMGKNRE